MSRSRWSRKMPAAWQRDEFYNEWPRRMVDSMVIGDVPGRGAGVTLGVLSPDSRRAIS